MAMTIYGIKNCDTMKKARAWLDSHGVRYAFHDYKVAGIEKDTKSLDEAKASLADARRELRELLTSAFDLTATDETLLDHARKLLVSQVTRRAFEELLEEGAKARSALESARRAMDDAAR